MQTFLPFPDFESSAAVLDRRRLGKQRVECKQILQTLAGVSDGWRNHPAVLMWKGHEGALCAYMRAVCAEWTRRGYRDNLSTWLVEFESERPNLVYTKPSWLGDRRLHSSHRSRLLVKDPEWYGQFDWQEIPGFEYHWPVRAK